MFKLSFFAIPPLITGAVIFLTGIYVLLKNLKNKVNVMFSLFAFSLSLWLFGYVMMYFSKEPSQALFWARIGFIGITFIPIFAYHFIITFLEKPVPRWLLVLIYSSVIPGVILSQSNFVYNGIGKYFWGFYPTAGPLYFIFLGMFAFLFSYGVLLLSLGIIEAERVKEYGRSQKIKYVFVAFLGGTTGIVDYIIKYKIPIYPFGYLAALFFITIIAIAIIKEHLFDIDLAAYYVFTWLMSLGTAAGVFLISFLLAFIFPLDLFIKALLLVISSTALAALFPWYFSKYEDWSNKHILHGKYDYLKIMPQKATDWLKHLDLGELIKAVTNDFKGVMGFEDVKIFLYGDYAIGSHEAARNCYFINPDNLDDEGVFNISKETALVKFAEAQNRPIYLNDLNKEIQSKGVRKSVRRAGEQVIKEMEDLKFEAVLPLSYGDGRTNNFVGFIGFGRWLGKREETIIEDKDKKFFEKLGTVLETAFRHALENRKADILDQKKSTMISDTMDEVQKLGEEKTKLEKELAKSKSRTLSFADMASEYATKIQILNESMEDLEAVTRYSQSAVLTIRNNLIKTANRQARHMLVGIGGKIVGEPFEKILSKQFRNTEQIIEDIKKVIETGASSGVFETEWVQDGRKVPVEIKIMPLKDRFEIGQVNGALVEIIDITHAKEREKLLHLRDKFETFRDVLEGLRHELNNAMNILSSYSYAVKNLKPEAINNEDFKKDFCTVIPKTAKFVSELLDNLAAAHTPLVMDGAVEVGIPEVLEETLKIFMPRWEAANIKVEKNISPVPRIKIRPELLKTIFYELVKNSIEAIEEYDYQRQLGQVAKTGGTIWISLKTNDAGEIEIEVKDNGIGIDEVNLAKVLNPFYTTKIHSVTHPETGTGLGLNKVYNIVQAFNGNLQITSKLGEGTKVILSLKPII